MSPNVSGTTHTLEVSYDGGNEWEEVKGVDNIEFDTTNERLSRPFVDGTRFEAQTQFDVAVTGRVTYIDNENQEKLFGSYFYEANEALDSNPNISVGENGGLKLGLARKVQTAAIVRLRPLLAAQKDHMLNWVNATIELGEPNFEDGLVATQFRVAGEEVVKGELVYNTGS